jgi:RNA polymerase sigma-70 factor (ECF subfamily)
MIRKAADGMAPDREDFAIKYEPVARAYLLARWRNSRLLSEVDDTLQDVFLDCFKENGALSRVRSDLPGGFRAYFYGIVRNAALHHERALARRLDGLNAAAGSVDNVSDDDTGLSSAFDRAWAEAIVREAVERHRERAHAADEAAVRRFELLRLRYSEGLAIREIAHLWETDADILHHEHARAREEYRQALLEVVAFHYPGTMKDVEEECRRILEALQ